MTVRYNVSVRSFPFWGDAFNTRCVLSDEQCDMVEMVLRNEYGDAISACTLNDIFEYDRDYIANIVGFASFRDLLESDDEFFLLRFWGTRGTDRQVRLPKGNTLKTLSLFFFFLFCFWRF